jgi:predicted transcriptional regulator
MRGKRLTVERRAVSGGIAAGDIARKLGIPANTRSAQLLVLSNAGLIRARRARSSTPSILKRCGTCWFS